MLVTMLASLNLLAQDENPILTLRSSQSSFTIAIGGYEADYIDVDEGNGLVEKELAKTELDTESGELTGTILTFSPKNGEVKIYGNAENISFLNLNGCYLTHVDVSALTKLSFLYINNNEGLDGLDLTNNNELRYLEAFGCPMTNGFTIGKKPELQIMSVAQTGNFRDFNTANYPKLKVLSCWGNSEITQIDAHLCPDLIQLSCDGTNIAELDVTKNKNLQILNIEDTRIRHIDLSKNLYLTEFYGSHDSGSLNTDVKLDGIDLSGNPNLVRLRLAGNDFTSIDVRNKKYLRYLNVSNNRLREIDLTGCDQLSEVLLSNNYFGFSTLPLPSMYWQTYDYYQFNMKADKNYRVGAVLDYSDMVLREGTNTTCGLFMVDEDNANNVVALDESYYTFDAETGKVTLLKETDANVFLGFANDAFPGITLTSMPLRTDNFRVRKAEDFGQPVLALTFTPVASGNISFLAGVAEASGQTPRTLYVDFGNGLKKEFNITDEKATTLVSGTVTAGKTVSVYNSQDDGLSALTMENIALTDIDVTQARSLRWLTLKGTALKAIDLGWNKALQRLEMSGNDFGKLNVAGANYAFNKSMLGDIFLPNNGITEVQLTDNNYSLRNVDLSGNKLTAISFKDADRLQTLNISGNELTELDVNYSTEMTALNASHNKLTRIVLPTESRLQTLNLEDNALDFATLPLVENLSTYTFSPQQMITIGKQGPGVDLSNYMVNGQTKYVWKKDATALTAGSDYTETEGKFVFAKSLENCTLTCEMTNSLFPGLTLTTSEFKVVPMPTHMIASFTTLESQAGTLTLRSSEANNTICVDWNGDGSGVEYYTLGTDTERIPVTSKAGANAKVYTYGENSNLIVFGLSDMKLADVDMSGLKELSMLILANAGINSVKWPESSFMELNLEGNNFSSIDLGTHAKDIFLLNLMNNKFESFDATQFPNLGILNLFNNQLTSVTLNSNVWQVDLGRNQLKEIDLSQATSLNQLALTENQLSHIDISSCKYLASLYLDRNNFKFSTLPLDAKRMGNYFTYANQTDLEVEEVDAKVDLSNEAVIADSPTTYRWFIGKPTVNEETYELEGEELVADDEYKVENGVTYFNYMDENPFVCVMTNTALPNLTLYTAPVKVQHTVDAITSTAAESDFHVSVEGRTLCAENGSKAEIILTDMNGRQLAKAFGSLRHTVAAPGIYLVITENRAAKVVVK